MDNKKKLAIVLFGIPLLGVTIQAVRFFVRGDIAGGFIYLALAMVLLITVRFVIIKNIR